VTFDRLEPFEEAIEACAARRVRFGLGSRPEASLDGIEPFVDSVLRGKERGEADAHWDGERLIYLRWSVLALTGTEEDANHVAVRVTGGGSFSVAHSTRRAWSTAAFCSRELEDLAVPVHLPHAASER
jgi:hypothetical protein